ncbi:MAG TPA: thioesterase family protein [Candidatus Sulfotelmatobacter sp.]|nr:thioesterase family protein [Candidatus Sulfotelmatobacter sp.]
MSARHDPPPGPFRYQHPIEVRFSDTDAMGHVNNAVYLTYFELARAGYYRAVTGRVFETLAETDRSLIMAHARVEYRAPTFFGETVVVACRAAWVSRSSFSLEYRLIAAEDSPRGGGRLLADGETIQVAYDYAAGRATRLDPEMVRALEAYEGRPIPPRPVT